MTEFSIDLHCHPAMHPFGKSFSGSKPGDNSANRKAKNSIWHYDPPGAVDRALQRTLGLSKYSQADLSTLSYGNVRCVCASLYSIEKGFVHFNTLGDGSAADFILNLCASLGKDRINFLQKNTDYFADLENEYKFYVQLHDKEISFPDAKRKYILLRNFAELERHIQAEEEHPDVEQVYVIITIEGLHDLSSDNSKPLVPTEILANLQKMKGWEYKPFFVTFAHHFYNELCGHAESLADFIQDILTNQEPGMNTGFTDLGWQVVDALLDNSDGKRIHIDLKHMSALSRTQYIQYLKNNYAEEYRLKKLPLIISHGACNGLVSATQPQPTAGMETTASRMYAEDINFYDEELLELARSGGIIGLQLDERRIASKRYKKSLRLTLASKTQRMHSNSKMVWNNIQHIVQLLDMNDIFAWDYIAIGSDYDGVIDPINMFWSAEEMDDLVQYIERHAFNFFNDQATVLKNTFNRIDPAEVVSRIFHYNSYEFFRKHFR